MAKLEILTIPDPRLKNKSQVVKSFDKNLQEKVNNMFEALYGSGNGIGLAAPQVGIFERIVIIDLKENNKLNPRVFINPRIIKKSDKKIINEEGCLSVPEYFAEVERSEEIELEWYSVKGEKNKLTASGLLSICLQHEIDHLEGVLFIDYLSKIKKKMALEKLIKLKKKKEKNEIQ